MVVDSHTFTAFNLFGNYIPYNSFFMPMFVFISGYFNKVDSSTKLSAFLRRKIRTLLLPYLGISVAVFGLQWLIDLYKLGEVPSYPPGYLVYMLQRVVTIGAPYALVTPMWFVISLFSVLMVYAVMKKRLFRIWHSYIMFPIFACLNLLVVYLAKNMDPVTLENILLPLKVLFLLPFIELGILYREYLEGKHEKLSGGWKVGLLFALLIVNVVRSNYMPLAYDIAFDRIDDLSGFTSPYIITPLISSIIGIAFWLTIVDLLGKPLQESRLVNYISCNTFWIMGFQIAFFNVLNCILMAINENLITLPYFNSEYFMESEWYYWEINSNVRSIYVVFGLFGPLVLKLLYDKIVSSVVRKK
ncbi:MAG: acyltransferase family protein [Lachnospiraceae bacterium]|nr:acyltransferase family protein [Lachnospiraceae bacterium]